jgi:hypothetical protein
MTLQAASHLAQVLAAVFAIALARKHAPHRAAAVALVALAASGILHALVAAALRPLPRPVEGNAVVLIYLDGALSLASSAIIAGLPIALAVPPERRRHAAWTVVGVWLAASVGGAIESSSSGR